jgi:tol-pal system protein YbgF
MPFWLRPSLVGLLLLALAVPSAAPAQTTLADIREELTILNGQIQQLRDELVRTGSASGLPRDPAPALTRLDQLEAELRALTNRVDVLTNDVDRIVQDGTNRIGDIEFRLTELEGGDTSLAGQASPLGGGVTPPAAPTPPATETATGAGSGTGGQLAVSEQSDFDAARSAYDSGNHAQAIQLFDAFLATYPVGPLSSEAQFLRGEAQAAQGDWNPAARSYLDAFSGAPDGPVAPRALYRLAVSLGQLGKVQEACLTLTEVNIRYPGSEAAAQVPAQRQALRCQ